ncbi:MAG: hypothetical protein ACRDMX_10735, partial [Solirubrobacteraceae bacterium]
AWPVAAGVAVAAVALVVAARQPRDGDRSDYRPFAAAARAVTAALVHPRNVYIAAQPPFPSTELAYELVYALRRAGATVRVAPAIAGELGGVYDSPSAGIPIRLRVSYGDATTQGARAIARVRVEPPAFTPGLFTVTLR